ncbi:hypothetical protein F2P81_019785 [Scophthalmus maximus]|uniref:Uncharacterized protein n=1 Tax=Scophthalmus maximus TaxID=52904 RepID=A0A6A4S8S6_SCOMX|nr:hypothetical protein F2P81_019785 [Scophthalmus maximus]
MSGTRGSSGFGSHSKEHMDNKTERKGKIGSEISPAEHEAGGSLCKSFNSCTQNKDFSVTATAPLRCVTHSDTRTEPDGTPTLVRLATDRRRSTDQNQARMKTCRKSARNATQLTDASAQLVG